MAASFIFILSLVLLVGNNFAASQDDDYPSSDEGAPCVTGKGIPGNCMIRNDCEFNTAAIDLTLYEPKGYNRTCPAKRVCCPVKNQVPRSAQPPQTQEKDEDFSFDDDD